MKPKNKPGQGRPTINGERKMLSLRLPVNLIEKLPVNKTTFIEMAIMAALENEMNVKKISIAKRFVENHKKNNASEWQPLNKTGDDKFISIYESLIHGVYGEVTHPYDDEESRVEIGRFESATGSSVEFNFTADA